MATQIEYKDIFFTEAYSDLFKDTAFGGEPCHFNYAGIDYRFYKRPIPKTPYFDIVSPYGYSGPVLLVNEANPYLFQTFFSDYCAYNKIIAEFVRINPFRHWLSWEFIHYEHDIFYIDLTKSEDEIWHDFDKGCKSAIKKAEKLRLILDFRPDADHFAQLYWDTIDRVKGGGQYSFRYDTIEALVKLGNLLSIWRGERIIAGTVILAYGDYCHYFLSASIGDNSGATNLLIWEAVKWAKAQGCKIFNLGGGLKAGDSLESFKKSFTKLSKPFYTYRKIHNQKIYDELSKGIETDYFPAYRAERLRK